MKEFTSFFVLFSCTLLINGCGGAPSAATGASSGGNTTYSTITATVNGVKTVFYGSMATDCAYTAASNEVEIAAYTGTGDTGSNLVLEVESSSLPAALNNIVCGNGDAGIISYADGTGNTWTTSTSASCSAFDSGAFSGSGGSSWNGSATSATMSILVGSGSVTITDVTFSCPSVVAE